MMWHTVPVLPPSGEAGHSYVYAANPERFAQFATNVFDIPCFADFNESTALAGIEAMEDFFRSVHMPTSLRELGLDLTDEQIHELAFKCSFEDTRTIGVFTQLNMKDMEKIYHDGPISISCHIYIKQAFPRYHSCLYTVKGFSLFLLDQIYFGIISTFWLPPLRVWPRKYQYSLVLMAPPQSSATYTCPLITTLLPYGITVRDPLQWCGWSLLSHRLM